MRYLSTQGGVTGLTFEEALLSGYASDGGMIFPDRIPTVTPNIMKQWANLTYPQLVREVTRLYISEQEIPNEDLDELYSKAFARFSEPEVVKTARLSNDLNILELFHGPTLAFKDLALGCVGQFYDYFLEKRKRHMIVLVGTSGDTGSAAIEAVKNLQYVDIVVLLPRGRCARIQELQMTTVISDNVHVFRVDGTSDDLDAPIKTCLTDVDFAAKHHICSINSLNWVRIMVQIAHFYYAYFQLRPKCDGEVEIVVPTGALGNVTGGSIAREMGLPVRFVCAVNTNDIVARIINSGDFSVNDSVTPTLAPAMDIQVPYNIERLLFLYSGGNAELVKRLMKDFEGSNSKAEIPKEVVEKIQQVISSYTVDNAGIKQAMKTVYDSDKYLLCPHTAVAVKYHLDNKTSGMPRICIATASPAKFEEAVVSAGLTPQPTPAIKALDTMPTRYREMEKGEDWLAMLRATIEDITAKRRGGTEGM